MNDGLNIDKNSHNHTATPLMVFSVCYYCCFLLFISCVTDSESSPNDEPVLTMTLRIIGEEDKDETVYSSGGDSPSLSFKFVSFQSHDPDANFVAVQVTGVDYRRSNKLAADLDKHGGKSFAFFDFSGIQWRVPVPVGAFGKGPDGEQGWTSPVPASVINDLQTSLIMNR